MPAKARIIKSAAEGRRRRAEEWKRFRRDYLFSQSDLASALGCSRRTITNVESAERTPLPRIQRAFRDLRLAQKRLVAA